MLKAIPKKKEGKIRREGGREGEKEVKREKEREHSFLSSFFKIPTIVMCPPLKINPTGLQS